MSSGTGGRRQRPDPVGLSVSSTSQDSRRDDDVTARWVPLHQTPCRGSLLVIGARSPLAKT